MTLFWILSALLVLGALVPLLWPLLRAQTAPAKSEDNMSQVLHDRQLNELQQEYANGLIDDSELAAARQELELGYCNSSETAAVVVPKGRGARLVAPVVTLLLLPVLAVYLYLQLGASELVSLDGAQNQAAERNGQHSVTDMVVQLRERLQREPEDAEGWMLLGRSYMLMKSYQEAVVAFQFASQQVVGDGRLMADYAEALVLANGNRFNEQVEQLINQALKLQPNNAKALWLAGVGATDRGEQRKAAGYWRKLLPLLAPDSEQARTLRNYIAEAEGGGSLELIPNSSADNDGVASQDSEINTAQISVSVNISPELAARVNPEDTLFIFARAAQGPKMPLAIVRGKAADLPKQVVLDDTMAMMPQMKLSLFDQVIVGARISKSGDATARKGDFQGISTTIQPNGAESLVVVINEIVN